MIGLRLPERQLAVLCLGAHPDDIEIGCGGSLLTIAKARALSVKGLVLTGQGARREEALGALSRFCPGADVDVVVHGLPDGRLPAHWGDVKQLLEDAAVGFEPDLIFAPRMDDAHQDHRLLAELVTTVWRDTLVLRYEIPKWDGDLGRVTHYLGVPSECASLKVDTLDECFASQRSRKWWSADTFLSIMRLRGIECGRQYAEGFIVEKAEIVP
jgi:LmbE family N-acetylglucosaminyl deacetylase